MNTPTLLEAMKVIGRELRSDPGYRQGWVANIAMAFKDEWARQQKKGDVDLHHVANKAAENFLDLLCLGLDQVVIAAGPVNPHEDEPHDAMGECVYTDCPVHHPSSVPPPHDPSKENPDCHDCGELSVL